MHSKLPEEAGRPIDASAADDFFDSLGVDTISRDTSDALPKRNEIIDEPNSVLIRGYGLRLVPKTDD